MDDKALFEAATSDATPAAETPAVEAAPEAQPEQPEAGQPRDEHGRFAPKVGEPEQAPAQAVQPAQPAVVQQPAPQIETRNEPPPGWLPAWRVREMVEAAQRKAAPQQPVEEPDPYIAPKDFRDQGIRQAVDPVVSQIGQIREHYSWKDAMRTHGQETAVEARRWFEQAVQQGDPNVAPLLQRAVNSIDPFEDIVSAFKQHKTLTTIGPDPNKWFEAELERRKSDPEFVSKHLTPVQGQPQQPNGAAPATNVVKLPPSLNRQPGAAQAPNAGSMNDADLYRSAIS